jgi:carbohydrate kinase (thermoresistant glucokinase family)
MAPVLVVMGVSGSGKTTVAEGLAARLRWPLLEGDTLHPPANVAKMKSGTPLTDADRLPWLQAIAARIDEWRRAGSPGIVTCSALKRSYRRILTGDRPEVRLVFLSGSRQTIAPRIAARRGHFMPPTLLQSQLDTLEPPGPDESAITASVDGTPDEIVEEVLAKLRARADLPAAGGGR